MKKNCRSVDDRPLPCSVLEVNSYNGEYQLFNILCTDCTALIRDAKAIAHLVDSHWYWNHIMGSGIKIERFHIPSWYRPKDLIIIADLVSPPKSVLQ